MRKRMVCIWFPYLVTDWMARRNPELKNEPFVLFAAERGRMIIKAASIAAHRKGIFPGMALADCRAIFPDIIALNYPAGKAEQLLQALAEWCIRFTPVTGIDLPGGIILDGSGCSHLWQGDEAYLSHILVRLEAFGYHARAAMSDTIASAWALSRYGNRQTIIPPGEQLEALMELPPAALRLEQPVTDRLTKLGMTTIRQFARLSRPALRKRFGASLLTRLDQAEGCEPEFFQPVRLPKLYRERLHSLEPICTAKGIEIAIERLLSKLCLQLETEGKGLRNATLKCYRVDNNVQELNIGTNLPTRNASHLFKLFELKINQLQPDLGFELFELEAGVVESIAFDQSALWSEKESNDMSAVAELLDKIAGKKGKQVIRRYLPAEHYWPERSCQPTDSLTAARDTEWRTDMPRPVHLLARPERIEVTVPLPDYPPMLFRYKGVLHPIRKADGPERIEQEWWLQQGVFRDYYCVEDEQGQRYWLFRAGHYENGQLSWYIHGFFA